MSIEQLVNTARALMVPGKGLLTIDESATTLAQRFEAVKLRNSPANRRAFHELVLTTPQLNDYISGVVLYEETLRQSLSNRGTFGDFIRRQGIIPGVRADQGMISLAGCPGESVTEGLDGLPGRLEEATRLGARFTKWRAALAIGEEIPSVTCIASNIHALARFALVSQELGLLPIVELDILTTGDHSIEASFEVTQAALHALFATFYDYNIALEGMLLTTSMVLPGQSSMQLVNLEEVAESTVMCLKSVAPAMLAGVLFGSGGESDDAATARLNAIHTQDSLLPWPVSFAFGRALHQAALQKWGANPPANQDQAQQILLDRLQRNHQALLGQAH